MVFWIVFTLALLFFWLKFPKIRADEKRKREYNEKYFVSYIMFDPEDDEDIIELLRHLTSPEAYLFSLVSYEAGISRTPYLRGEGRYILPGLRLNSVEEVSCVKVEFMRKHFQDQIDVIEAWPLGERDERMKRLIRADMEANATFLPSNLMSNSEGGKCNE